MGRASSRAGVAALVRPGGDRAEASGAAFREVLPQLVREAWQALIRSGREAGLAPRRASGGLCRRAFMPLPDCPHVHLTLGGKRVKLPISNWASGQIPTCPN